MPKLYAGIGSRKTPEGMLLAMQHVGRYLADKGYTLRSGNATGADQAFQRGAWMVAGRAEVLLPWEGFESGSRAGVPLERLASTAWYVRPSPAAFALASTVHPAWARLSQGGRALQARNMHQVLGWDLQTPVDFVQCWTPDGAESEADVIRTTGGTGTAIRLASRRGIPVINLQRGLDRAQRRLLDLTGWP